MSISQQVSASAKVNSIKLNDFCDQQQIAMLYISKYRMAQRASLYNIRKYIYTYIRILDYNLLIIQLHEYETSLKFIEIKCVGQTYGEFE